ncbi:MAG: hypothetical protein ACLQFR_10535 [Streptosporangiaceae bacterium]
MPARAPDSTGHGGPAARPGSGCRADSWPAGASRWRQQSVWVLIEVAVVAIGELAAEVVAV